MPHKRFTFVAALSACFTCMLTAQIPKSETQLVLTYLDAQAKTADKDVPQFTRLTQPYAPLDFQVRASTNAHASDVRNYLFGVAAASSNMDPKVAPAMANDFHCGQPCAEQRFRKFVEQHERVSALVARFVPLVQLKVVSQWGVSNDYRVNDTFIQKGVITTFSPAGDIGVLPNASGKQFKAVTDATGLNLQDIATAESMAAELSSLGIAAIVRSPQGIRIVRSGCSDNQSGLLFKRRDVPEPKEKDDFGEGLELVIAVKVAQDIYYFETS